MFNLSLLLSFVGCLLVIFFVQESLPKKKDPLINVSNTKSYLQIMKDKAVLVTVILYSIEALLQCSFDSLLSLWLSSSKKVGGFGLSIEQIGWLLSFICPMQAGNSRIELVCSL